MPKLQVLLVDDDLDDIEMLEEALQKVDRKINSISFRNAKEALHWLERSSEKPDFIFLDLNMSPLNGFQCLSKLKEKNDWKDIPVVIYTTFNLDEYKDRCLIAGAWHFITKPSSFNELVDTLCQLLTNKAPVL